MRGARTAPLGRPRGFDRERAIEVALRLFWRHGYEGVSVSDLTEAIGIAPPSLYAAFGSKAGLFREALERYERGSGALDLTGFDEAQDLDRAVRAMLGSAVRAVTDPERERGCMISSGMIACGAAHDELARELVDRRRVMREAIDRKLRRWMNGADASSLARYLAVILLGLSIQARDGATRRELEAVVDEVSAALAMRAHPRQL